MPGRLPDEKDTVELIIRLNGELEYKGTIISICQDTVIANGNEAHWDFIHHGGTAAMVPMMEGGKILMIHQYRNTLDRETLEIPAGKVGDPKEPRVECAYRELEEETGFHTEELEFLIQVSTTVAFYDEGIDIFMTENLIPSHQSLSDDEEIKVGTWKLSDLLKVIYSGKMMDAKAVAAVTAYAVKYGEQNAVIWKRASEIPDSRHSYLTQFIEFSRDRWIG